MKYIFYFSVVLYVFIFSCTKDKANLLKQPEPVPVSASYCDSMKTAGKVSFKCIVDTILRTNCATSSSCHGTGAPQPNFLSHTNDSIYAQSIKQRAVIEKSMPPGGPLPDSLLQKIAAWVDDGARNN